MNPRFVKATRRMLPAITVVLLGLGLAFATQLSGAGQAAALITQAEHSDAPRSARHPSTHARHGLAVPFFSFSARR